MTFVNHRPSSVVHRTMYDAVVVGAGPAGSALGALLARAGFSVLLLDRAAFPRDKPCGEYTSPETCNVLARLGTLEAVERAGGRKLRAMHLVSPGGRRFALEYSPPGAHDGPHVLATTRRALDAVLVDHARRSGAEVRERVKVEAVTLRGGRVAGVVVRERRGCVEEIQARLVIGADGVHSAVVRSLGLAAPVRWPRNLGLVAHYSGYRGLDDWGEMHVSERGYAGLAPQAGGLLNVGLVMPLRGVLGSRGSSAERFEAFAMSFPGVAEVLEGARRVSAVRGVGPIGARVKRTSGAGYMLVGDAAGFFDPFTGEGVYKALRGAELAAGVASGALERDDLSARSLAEYDRLRRREFGAKEMVCRLVQLFVGLPTAMDYVAARLAERPTPRQVLTGVLGDYADPRAALSPVYLWSLLRP
ncbi:MAG: NAD(P)/FAD-dependent oxidoreductase [Chloroflexia bacterium]